MAYDSAQLVLIENIPVIVALGPFPAPGTLLRVRFRLSTSTDAAVFHSAMALCALPDATEANMMQGLRIGRGVTTAPMTVPAVRHHMAANWSEEVNRGPNAKIRDPYLYLILSCMTSTAGTGILGHVEATSSELVDPHPLTLSPAAALPAAPAPQP